MKRIILALPGNEKFAEKIAMKFKAELGEIVVRSFPDGESYVRVISNVNDKKVLIVCTLDHPDQKILPLYFLAQTVKELGAKEVGLICPYLAYMRQDKRFHPGEAVTSTHFAKLISQFADWMVTIDPHLHRRNSMSEIYSIPVKVLHAAPLVSAWIKDNIKNPLLVGPDSESEQWVKKVAEDAGAPFIVLEKVRKGDKDVEIKVPDFSTWKNYQPVLVDDIISTAHTMIETTKHLLQAGFNKPVCIGVHGIFAGNAYRELMDAGADSILSSDAISHETNRISIAELVCQSLAD
ncbi:MAG: ribose-phosphate pyrophosphokinase [Cytophagaceae bacterium]|nr:ribose-phosphate pyrophosphokinase [Cytophagaceae bacterium]